MRELKLIMDTLESIPSVASVLLALQIWKRLNTCSTMFRTERSPSTIASSSGVVWHQSFSMRFHDMETAYGVLLGLSSLQSVLTKSSLTVDTDVHLMTLRIIDGCFISAS